jgi:hypothetical protein
MIMHLDEDTKNYVRLVVLESNAAQSEVLDEKIKERVDAHQKTCPVGEEFRILKAKMFGLLAGIGLGSAGVGGAIAAIISKVFT